MAKRKISARELLRAINDGATEQQLMAQFGLSGHGLKNVCDKMIAAGMLSGDVLSRLQIPSSMPAPRTSECPACKSPLSGSPDECPVCGIVIAKYGRKTGKRRTPQEIPVGPTSRSYPKGKPGSLRFVNPVNNHVEATTSPWVWTLLFGPFYFAYKGLWGHAVLGTILGIFTLGLSWIVYCIVAKKLLRNHYGRLGWKEIDESGRLLP